MKKAVWMSALTALAGVAIIFAVRSFVVESVSAQEDVSERTAGVLQVKLDAVKNAEKAEKAENAENAEKERAPRAPESVEFSDVELESYVLYSLRDDIPARVDSIDVQLSPGVVSADTKMTFGTNPTNNPLIDALIGGTHRLFVKGKLSASAGKAKFTLEEARVDGIPVPIVLIETLVEKFVKPRHPDVKLDEPFTMPWGIEDLAITSGKATIIY